MKNPSLMLKDAQFTLFIPLGIKGICYFAKNLMPNLFPSLRSPNFSEDENPFSWVGRLDNLISAAFNDYVSFIIMMLILSLLVELIKAASCYLIFVTQTQTLDPKSKTDSSSFYNGDDSFWKIKGVIIFFCKLMMCSTILFAFCQLTSSMASSIFDDAFLSRNDSLLFESDNLNMSALPQAQTYRILDQLSSGDSFEDKMISPTLNIGEILGSFSHSEYCQSQEYPQFCIQAAVLSKDGKILFVLIKWKLFIFNISNPNKEQKIGELRGASGGLGMSMLLSQDETVLFLSGEGGYSIINVSNQSAPSIILTKIKQSGNQAFMALSSDGNTLYLCGDGTFEIFNVSQPTSPVLIYQKIVDHWTTMALSNDNSKLLLSNQENFEIFNVIDPNNPIPVSKAKIPWNPSKKITFSNDGKKAFIAGSNIESEQLYLQIFDMQNPASPFLLSSTDLGPSTWGLSDGTSISLYFDKNKRFAFYFTKYEFKMIQIENLEQITLFASKKDPPPVRGGARFRNEIFALSADYQTNVVFIDFKTVIVRLNIDVTPQSFIHLKSKNFQVIEEIDYHRKPAIALSKDEKTLFLVKISGGKRQLFPFERVRNTLFKMEPVQLPGDHYSSSSADIQWSLLAGNQSVLLIRQSALTSDTFNFLSNLKSTILTQTIKSNVRLKTVAVANDEKKIVFITYENTKPPIQTLNIITLQNETTNYFLDFKMPPSFEFFQLQFQTSQLKFSHEDNIIFCADSALHIYDIRNPRLPFLKSSSLLRVEKTLGLTFSKDEKILYHAGYNWTSLDTKSKKQLQIFDISDIEAPKLLSSIWFNLTCENFDKMELSHDEKILSIGLSDRILMIDVRVLTQPVLFGSHYLLDEVNGLQFTNNKSILYAASIFGVTVHDMTSQYTLLLSNSSFKIGGSYSVNINVLKMNSNLKFDYIKKHKFLKVSQFEPLNGNLPAWITFDKERALLVFEPRAASNAGKYKILVTFSTQIQAKTFTESESLLTELEAKNLMFHLLQCGYIDTEGYVSESFDPNQELWLDSRFQGLEKFIQAILSQNHLQAIGEFSVSPSLELLETIPLTISSLKKDHISVSIKLTAGEFLAKVYTNLKSTITNRLGQHMLERSYLHLEGSLEDMNEGLKQIIVYSTSNSVIGRITVSDGLNEPVSRFFDNMTVFLDIPKIISASKVSYSKNPILVINPLITNHITVTIHLDRHKAIKSKCFFVNKQYLNLRSTITNNKTQISLEGGAHDVRSAFQTLEVDHGTHTYCGGEVIVTDGVNPTMRQYFPKITKYFTNNTAPIYNHGLSLQDQIDKRPFYTGLYQTVELNSATFVDQNGLPLQYSLHMENAPLGIQPSWISIKGRNLMGTPPEQLSPLSYRFILKVKNEFKTTKVPFTLNVRISFVYAAKLIMTYVGYIISFLGLRYSVNKVYNLLAMKYYRYPRSLRVGEKITDNEIFPISFVKTERTKSKGIFKALQKHVTQNYQCSLLEYFIVPGSQILDKEKIISTLDELDHKYSNDFSRGVIEQLIINMIVTIQLAQKQEAETKKTFVKIQEKWMDLVFPVSLSSRFVISQEKLQQELAEISPEFIQEMYLNESTLSTELLSVALNEKINMDLLSNAILARAFDRQNLNITSILTDVISYKKLKGTSLWHKLKKLLLQDLKPFVVLNKREIGYGIEYNIDDDTLFFSGQLTHDLQDNIIIIHIKNNRGRILRELCLTGADKDAKRSSIMDQIPVQL